MLISVAMENFMGEGKLAPIGVDLRVWIRWSIEIPYALAVVRKVFIVLIWHSMKPLDLGQRGMKLSGQCPGWTKIWKRVQRKRGSIIK